MISVVPTLFVRIEQFDGPRAPIPKPLESGFHPGRAYRVLGVAHPSETSDAYFILSNDLDEPWFISQRHLRFAGLYETDARHLDLPSSAEGLASGPHAAD